MAHSETYLELLSGELKHNFSRIAAPLQNSTTRGYLEEANSLALLAQAILAVDDKIEALKAKETGASRALGRTGSPG